MKKTKVIKYDLNSNELRVVSEKIDNRQYSLKGYNKNGSSNFNTDKKNLEYDNILYYDIETIKIGQNFDNENYTTLDLSYNILYSFSILVPKKFKKDIENLKEYYEIIFSEEEKKIFDIEEKEEYYLIFSYSENTENNLFELLDIFTFFRNNHNNLKVIGFNNNKFDDLIFKHLLEYNLIRNEKDKFNQLIVKFNNDKNFKISFYDLIDLSKSFRLHTLKQIGEYLNFPKLNINEENIIDFKEQAEIYKKYNNRDNEILFYFLKTINQDLNIYETNIARWARKHFYNSMFKKLDVEYINSNGYINNFNLYGGRTEHYTHISHNVKYLDFNSLYTSSRVVLDIVKPVITEKKVKGTNRTYKSANYFLKQLEINEKLNYLINSFKLAFVNEENNNDYTYKALAKLYDQYSKNSFYMLKVKLKGYDELFEDKKALLDFYFPFIRKSKGKSTFSFSNRTTYEISFYEIIFLAFFDFEIIEAYEIGKGEDILKEDLIEIYKNRKILKEKGDKKEALEKLKLNSGYGIYATRNRTSEKIIDKRLIESLDNFLNRTEETLNAETRQIINELQDDLYFSWGTDYFKIKMIGNEYFKVMETKGKKWTDNSIPILSMNIVSNSRFMLYSLILDYVMNTEEAKIKIHYTDTDSLFCDKDIYERLEKLGYVGDKLGQLKDEIPENTIEELKVFAPKTYIYKLDNGYERKTFKGTGTTERKTIISQSLKSKFYVGTKTALNAETEQKRFLKNNLFLNKFGVSEELKEKWNEQMKKFDNKDK